MPSITTVTWVDFVPLSSPVLVHLVKGRGSSAWLPRGEGTPVTGHSELAHGTDSTCQGDGEAGVNTQDGGCHLYKDVSQASA